ncbi:MAG: toll/interleukin-1 receptor domain-containing protein [Terriglobia bacterium]
MANPEHVKILKQGSQAWNQWREANPDARPDLGGADLRGMDLRRANLTEANLAGADLITANLREAYLTQVDLTWVDLRGADLRRADLHGADLHGADLTGADVRGADLRRANLHEADLIGADLENSDFTNAFVAFTVFGDNDLSTVKGLETVEHLGPSTIGIGTIYKSKGDIPEAFLRRAGVPEDFIIYMKSLAANPIEFYSCFISYSSKDDDFARRLHADLQQNGVRCWFAPEDLKIGEKFRTRIDESIRVYDKLMVILTQDSIASPWVEEEVEAALEKERKQPGKLVLFPIRLDDAVMQTDQAWAASLRRTRHIGDFRHWKDHDTFQKAFDCCGT